MTDETPSGWVTKLRRTLKVSRKYSLVIAIALVVASAVAFQTLPALRWRVLFIQAKFAGKLEGLSWGEMLRMTRPGSQFDLWDVANGRSLGAALANPYASPEDRQIGAQIFRERCSDCHGIDAKGGRGPNLTATQLRHGDSDWAMYRTLRDGVPGTAMVPTGLTQDQAFRVIGFLRKRQHDEAGATTGAEVQHPAVDVPAAELAQADGRSHEWLTYSRTLDGRRFSPLTQIDSSNAASLKVLWVHQLDSLESQIEATPLVANGVMFLSEPPNAVVALSAKTGDQIWRRTWELPESIPLCCGKMNRGTGLLDGNLFIGTLDAKMLALDARDGTIKWQKTVADVNEGYSITTAPIAIADEVIVGVSGGDFGIRGFLVAYDGATGQERWRFNTIPGPGETGHETWEKDSWKIGGGPTWVPGSYDPETDLIFWGVGNPGPTYSGDTRAGDNLFTCSMIALHRTTGKLAWYFQFTPHDEHDWDANQTSIVADLVVNGTPRKTVITANRNGFYYVLDRTTGEFLVGTPFAKQTWAKGLDAHGRPIETPTARPTAGGVLISPGHMGAVNWPPPAFNPALSTFFVHATEGSAIMTKTNAELLHREPGQLYVGSGASLQLFKAVVKAIDAATGQIKWEYVPAVAPMAHGQAGLLATAGNVVMSASTGIFFVLDATAGKELWRLPLGGGTYAPPITFLNDEDKQVVVAIGGRSVFMLGE
jgi:alcohol dehydrogenase (cytochrome c)